MKNILVLGGTGAMGKPLVDLLSKEHRVYQLIYSRYFNRTFDNSKISQFCDITQFTSPEIGLVQCLNKFLD